MAYVVERKGRWTGYYRLGSQRLSAGTYDNEYEAKYHSIRAEKEGLRSAPMANLALSKWVENWLPSADLEESTKRNYRRIYDKYLMPELGEREVTSLTRTDVRNLVDRLRAKGVGAPTVAQAKAALGSILAPLVQTGQIASNPTHGITVKVKQGDLTNVLEPEEFKAIVKHLPNEASKLLAEVLVASGLRFGEATELRVKDFNFKTGELFVQRRVTDLGSDVPGRFLVVPATKSGYKRSLKLSKRIAKRLEEYVKSKALPKDELLFSRFLIATTDKIEATSLGANEPTEFLLDSKRFTHGTLYAYTHGKCRCFHCSEAIRKYKQSKSKRKHYQKRSVEQPAHLPRDVWRTIWNKAIAKSGIGWSPRTHDLRHANATTLLKNGVDLHEVKERLGHRSVKTTERYLHRLRHNQSEAAEVADDYLE